MTSSQTNNPEPLSSTRDLDRKLPSGIWVLGFVSLFMDVSSELVHSLLPIFMTTVLGASMVTVGIIEGVAESIAATTKVFSGALSDYFRKRKILVVI
ncbi:MAG: MFS transporter, partial [Gammaproteobacteria bacterium]